MLAPLAAALVIVGTACGGGSAEPTVKPKPVIGEPGFLYDVHGNLIYLECTGQGGPPVVLEAGRAATTASGTASRRTWRTRHAPAATTAHPRFQQNGSNVQRRRRRWTTCMTCSRRLMSKTVCARRSLLRRGAVACTRRSIAMTSLVVLLIRQVRIRSPLPRRRATATPGESQN